MASFIGLQPVRVGNRSGTFVGSGGDRGMRYAYREAQGDRQMTACRWDGEWEPYVAPCLCCLESMFFFFSHPTWDGREGERGAASCEAGNQVFAVVR